MDLRVDARGVPVRLTFQQAYGPQMEHLGALVTFESRQQEYLRRKVRAVYAGITHLRILTEVLLKVLRDTYDFDFAGFGVYSQDLKYFRML